MTREEFRRVVEDTLKSLPKEFQEKLTGVAVVIREKPDKDDPDETLLGEFRGSGVAGSVWDVPQGPEEIVIFKGPLEEEFPKRADLVKEIRRTVLHEVGHYLGMSESDLSRLGLD